MNTEPSDSDTNAEAFTIPVTALRTLVAELGSSIVTRDKEMYLAYASQYQVCGSHGTRFIRLETNQLLCALP